MDTVAVVRPPDTGNSTLGTEILPLVGYATAKCIL